MKSLVILMLIGCVAADYKPITSTFVKSVTELEISTFVVFTSPQRLGYAQVMCTRAGGELVAINSEKEHGFLVDLLKYYSVGAAWVGLHNTSKKKKFTWFKGNFYGGFKKWCLNQPDNHHQNNCVELSAKDDLNCLNIVPCHIKKPFICEINDVTALLHSGALNFMVNSYGGAVLTSTSIDNEALGFTQEEPYLHTEKPAALRMITAIAMVVLFLPPLASHILPAMLKWYFISVPVEIAFSLSLEVLFPEASSVLTCQGPDARFRMKTVKSSMGLLNQFSKLCLPKLLVPAHQFVPSAIELLGWQQRRTPLNPMLRTFAAALWCYFRAVSLQCYFDLQLMHLNGASYVDAVSLVWEVRHNACTACLAKTAMQHGLHRAWASETAIQHKFRNVWACLEAVFQWITTI